MRRACVVVLVLALAADLEAQERLGVAVPIEDPSGAVLPRIQAALQRVRRGGVARFSFWGASHTASDQYTGFLRERLQRRFGDAGAGLVMPAIPFPLYERRDVVIEAGSGWRGLRVRGRDRTVQRFGRAGFAIEARGAARARVRASSRVARAELWALGQEGGGTLELRAPGAEPITLATAGEPGARFAELELPSRPRTLELRALGEGPARVSGLVLESGRPGVIVESFGAPGARAGDQLAWDEPTLRAQIERRPPDLVALAYGTNESGDGTPMATLERELREVIARWQRSAPGAACLVIGPSDWPRDRGGVREPRPRSAQVRDLYRRVALAEECGFFDLLALQGGPGAIARWIDAGWALSDHVHMTDEGHARVAALLERALLVSAPRAR